VASVRGINCSRPGSLEEQKFWVHMTHTVSTEYLILEALRQFWFHPDLRQQENLLIEI